MKYWRSAMPAAKTIAAWAGVSEMSIGYAGLKDRHAVTRQRFTVHLPKKVSPDVATLASDEIRVLETIIGGRSEWRAESP